MQVHPHLSPGSVGKTAEKPVATARPAAGADSASFRNTQSVHNALQQVPEVRSEAVARAEALIRDPEYPPLAAIDAIGKLVAAVYSGTTDEGN